MKLFDPARPEQPTLDTMLNRGFTFDTASGVLRWHRHDRLAPDATPQRWELLQRGGREFDWIAVSRGSRSHEFLRIREWSPGGARFVLVDWLGAAIVGTCR
jgi:hypothetical protein